MESWKEYWNPTDAPILQRSIAPLLHAPPPVSPPICSFEETRNLGLSQERKDARELCRLVVHQQSLHPGSSRSAKIRLTLVADMQNLVSARR